MKTIHTSQYQNLPFSPSGTGAQREHNSFEEQARDTSSDQLNRDMHEQFVRQGIIFFQDRALARLKKCG